MISGAYVSALRSDGVMVGTEDVYVGAELVVISVEALPLHSDTVMLEDVTFAEPRSLVHLAVYLDGAGSLDAGQEVRPVLYSNGALVVSGPVYTVPHGAPASWVSLVFDEFGQEILGGDYRFGIHAGPIDLGARYYEADTAGSFSTIAAPFADGPPATVAAGATTGAPLLMYLETLTPVQPPADVTDDYLASLPFDLAQSVFSAGGSIRGSQLAAVAGWYGSSLNSTAGANAIVRQDGKLSDRVGERLEVRRSGGLDDRSVYVYVHDEIVFPDELATEDLLLSARAFLAIGSPGLDDLDVVVETLA